MNKTNDPQVKKVLLRNTSLTLPNKFKTTQNADVFVNNKKCKTKSKIPTSRNTNIGRGNKYCPTNTPLKCKSIKAATDLDKPDLQSTLKFSEKIDEITRPVKFLNDLDLDKLSISEKITKQVNIPPGQLVFKNLVPLTSYEVKPSSVQKSQSRRFKKYRELKLSDLLESRKEKISHP